MLRGRLYRAFSTSNIGGPGLVEVEQRVCLLIGKTGAGKTSIYNCIAGLPDPPYSGFRAGNFYNRPKIFKYENWEEGGSIGLIDTVGFQGSEAIDRLHFHTVLTDVRKTIAVVSTTFVCLTSNRLSEPDESIVAMLRNETTKEFQDTIVIVVTHTPPKHEAEVREDNHNILYNAFSFLGSKEEVQRRILFTDLMSRDRFEGAAGEQVKAEWSAYRKRLLDRINMPSKTVRIEDQITLASGRNVVHNLLVDFFRVKIVRMTLACSPFVAMYMCAS